MPAAQREDHDARLPRVVGLWDAVALVIGSIIGSGVFLKASVVAGELQSFGPIVLIWAGIGAVTFCGCLALSELAAMLPEAGGPYVYLRAAYGRLPAFLWGWTELTVIRTGSLGALASATVIYFNRLIPLPAAAQGPAAIALIALLTWLNWRSTRWGVSLQNLTVIVKMTFLLALIMLPLITGTAKISNLEPMWPTRTGTDFWRAVGVAAIAVLWPYDGWINIGPMAEEVRNPQRTVPIALALGMTVIIVIYVAVNSIYHLVLPMHSVQVSEGVASDVFQAMFGPTGERLAALGVMCSTFGATQSNLLAGPRIYFAMARDELLPRWLSRVHAENETPGNAVLIQGIWGSILVAAAYSWTSRPIDAFDALTDFVIFGGSLFYAMAVAAVFVLRIRHPEWPRPYRTWGYPWTPALYLLAFAGALTSMLIDKWLQTAAGSLLILAGVAFYYWRTRQNRRLDVRQ